LKLSISFEKNEIDRVRAIVAERLERNRRLVVNRLERNVEGPTPNVDDDDMWMAHLMCLLTTQQRSGPNSPVNQFLDRKPFPLSLAAGFTVRKPGIIQQGLLGAI
jgi:hypothetical protein